jgi:hypothetical protein
MEQQYVPRKAWIKLSRSFESLEKKIYEQSRGSADLRRFSCLYHLNDGATYYSPLHRLFDNVLTEEPGVRA